MHNLLQAFRSSTVRNERGLSQSTENVILLVGAVTIAIIVIGLVTNFVNGHLVLTP